MYWSKLHSSLTCHKLAGSHSSDPECLDLPFLDGRLALAARLITVLRPSSATGTPLLRDPRTLDDCAPIHHHKTSNAPLARPSRLLFLWQTLRSYQVRSRGNPAHLASHSFHPPLRTPLTRLHTRLHLAHATFYTCTTAHAHASPRWFGNSKTLHTHASTSASITSEFVKLPLSALSQRFHTKFLSRPATLAQRADIIHFAHRSSHVLLLAPPLITHASNHSTAL